MTVSIIIAVKTWQKNLEECVARASELNYPDFEVIILPDESFPLPIQSSLPIRIIPTGSVTPAKKRDIALKHAKGEILAFLDDDAYPVKDWLRNAAKNFFDPEVAAVGGPAVTPQSDSDLQKASGLVYASILVSGGFRYRYIPGGRQEVEDYPSCNFLVRKSVMDELGGFNTNFWPGEDTKLCLDIVHKLKKKIIYDPNVLVYHHRREVFSPHLKQIASYALHRGYFVKKYPETSLKFSYFMPSLFLFGLIGAGALSLFSSRVNLIFFSGVLFYTILALLTSLNRKVYLIPVITLGIILTHLTYGFNFIKGLLTARLREE